jgi:hypothetical protein
MDALLVASAKVGDGIAKALNLQAVGERLGDQITAIGDDFASLSEPTQTAVVALGGVVAATGPVLLGLGTLGVALPNIKAGYVAAQSGARLLSTSLVALLNPTTLVVAGVVALAAGAYYLATANERVLDSYREQAAATRKLTTDVAPLLDRYDELRAKTSLNAAEQAELKAIVEKVTAVMPAAGQGIDGYGNYIGLATEKAREFIKGNQGLEKAIALQSLPAQRQKLLDLSDAYDRLLDERDQLNRGAFNGVKVEDLGTRFLVDFQKELGNTATELEKQRRLVAELGSAAGVTAQQYDALGATFPTLAANLAKLGTAFPIPNFAGNADAITTQVGLLKKLHDQLKQLKEDQQNAGTELAALSFNPQIKGLQEYISRLEGADKTSKKATDAIKKLREELARLTVLDNVLGDAPTQLEVLERRSDTLLKGLKTLVDAGVNPNSRAFRSFALEAANLGQQIDQLKAIGGTLDLKPVAVKSLIPQTIGDTLPQDVARLLGDYAKQTKPFELPIAVKLNMQAILDAPKPFQVINSELTNLGNSIHKVGDVSTLFGGQLGAAFAGFDVAGQKANATREALLDLIDRGFGPFEPTVQALSSQLRQYATESENVRLLTTGLQDGFVALGSSIGSALGQGSNILNAGLAALIDVLADYASKKGKLLIADGIADLLIPGAQAVGALKIAAGTGLIVAAGVASAGAASLRSSASPGGASKPTSSPASAPKSYNPTTAPAAATGPAAVYTHKVEITASGRNLAGVLAIDTDRVGRVVGVR